MIPQLVANDSQHALRQAIAESERFACEPKVDGVRGLVICGPGLRRLAQRLPNVWQEPSSRVS